MKSGETRMIKKKKIKNQVIERTVNGHWNGSPKKMDKVKQNDNI